MFELFNPKTISVAIGAVILFAVLFMIVAELKENPNISGNTIAIESLEKTEKGRKIHDALSSKE